MPLVRMEDGVWKLKIDANEWANVKVESRAYLEALPRYLTVLEPAFESARS